MQNKQLVNGFALPPVGLGTWKMGGEREVDTSRDRECVAAIKAAINMGYIHIDTAAMYGVGHSEELVAEALKDSDRDHLTIATKVFPTELAHDDFLRSVEGSLERLRVDYVDLLYIHGPNQDISLSETMRAMNECVARGWTKYLAVSNFSVALMKEAQSLTDHKIVANQIEYNLTTRNKGKLASNMESEIIPYCQANDILAVAYKPVDRGALLEANPVMDVMVEKYQKTRAQIAINWLIIQDNIVTIPMSTQTKHLAENFAAADFALEPEDWQALDQEYKQFADESVWI